jgi:IMP dehydrogenase
MQSTGGNMRIQDLLKQKGQAVQTIVGEKTVEDAISKLTQEKVGALIVIEDNHPVGIFAERDVLRCHLQGKTFADVKVRDAMTNKLIVAEPEEEIETAMATMIQADIRHLPVLKNQKIIGMLTMSDLVKQQIGDLKAELHYLQDYISDLQDASQD